MMRTLALALCLTLGIGTLGIGAARATDNPPPSSGIQRIVAGGVLRVAVPNFDSPPFFGSDARGETTGYDIETARALGRELGVTVAFERRALTFDEAVDSVARGEADIAICKLSRTLRRAQRVMFTEPYAVLRHALIVNRVRFADLSEGREAQEVIHNYRGTLGVIANSSFLDYARQNFPRAEIRTFQTWNEVVAAVQSGAVAAAYRDDLEIKRLIAEKPALSLTLRTITLTDQIDTLGMAVPANDYQAVAYLNMFIARNLGLKTTDNLLNLAGGPGGPAHH